jgi:hypothetical protein
MTLTDYESKYVICVLSADKNLFFNGHIIELFDDYVFFADEVSGSDVYINRDKIIWYRRQEQ